MAKFSEIAKGVTARRSFTFTLPSGTDCTVDLAIILGENDALILRKAKEFAEARDVKDPKPGDPLYELGIWVNTIALGVVDPDSPIDAPQPFFDGGVPQILDEKTGLGREWIALLFQAQQAWQDHLAPRPKEMGPNEFLAHIIQIAEAPSDAELPFSRWRPALQGSFLRKLCGSWRELLQLKWSIGADSSGAATSSKPSAPPPKNEPPPEPSNPPKPEPPEATEP